jgi:hypothetical protein
MTGSTNIFGSTGNTNSKQMNLPLI